ncbi:MAG: glycosyltransferase [Kiloniellaceae bacterium]|nr:glycosyltransferase [Kiloniellaceae bacterium]
MTQINDAVGVVIPMFNAEATIGATLASVSRQTYQALDIIVVDDGSTDRSPSIVAAYAAKDRRIRLLRQANSGVAAARNFGAASTCATFLAFIDADDLWAPAKIARQMQALHNGGPSVGLVYCWPAHVDEDGRVTSLHHRPTAEGHVLRDMCRSNFVGNGSSMLLRRSAYDLAGHFDASLRARRAQGCEDLLMCFRIAENFEFRVVPQFLVGYRLTNNNMSSDVMQMLRSCDIVLTEFRQKYPQFATELDAHLIDMAQWLAVRALICGQLSAAWAMMKVIFVLEPRLAVYRLPEMLELYCRARLVPPWVKARIRRLMSKSAEFRPPYAETSW